MLLFVSVVRKERKKKNIYQSVDGACRDTSVHEYVLNSVDDTGTLTSIDLVQLSLDQPRTTYEDTWTSDDTDDF